MPSRYPLHMYHATANPSPVYALNQKQENDYTQQGYQERYIPRDYPRNLHHISGATHEVKSAAEEADYIGEGATHKDWSRKPFPRPAVVVGEEKSYRIGHDSQLEIENFQKIQELEFEINELKRRCDNLYDAATLQAEAIGAMSEQVDALTPKKSRTKETAKESTES